MAVMPMGPGTPSSIQDVLASLQAPAAAGPLPYQPTMPPSLPTSPMPSAGPAGPLPNQPMPVQIPSGDPSGGGGRGAGFAQILQQLMPAFMAAIAAKQGGPSAAGAMLQGLAQATQQQRVLKLRQQELDMATARDEAEREFKRQQWHREEQQQVAKFQTDAMTTLAKITDPAQYARTAELYDSTGQQMFGLQPGWLKATPPQPNEQQGAVELIDKLRQTYGADNFERLVTTDATLADGRRLSDVLSLANLQAVDPETGAFPTAPEGDGLAGTSDFTNYLRTVFSDFETTNGRKPTAAERRTLSLDARKEFNQVDDRGPDPTVAAIRDLQLQQLQSAGMSPAQQGRVEGIVNNFRTNAIVKRTQTMAEAVQFVDSLSDATTSPADDQALVYAFAKAMDPESVVREGEYATVQKYASTWLSQFGFNAARVVTESQFLTPDARRYLKDTIRKRFRASLGSYNNVRSQYGRQIDRISGQGGGVDFLDDYEGMFPQQQAPEAGAATTGPSVGERRTINGTPAEWDGRGWKAVQ